MHVLRTPEERFEGIVGYPYQPRHVEVPSFDGGSLRMAYVDEGPRDGEVVLMLHGEPTWGFLYRKVVAEVLAAGHRAVVPDLIGFGRSDKPASRADYSYERHVGWVKAFIDAVGLTEITLLCQDWGGLIGLRLVGEHPSLFARVVAANTFLPTGDVRPPDAFFQWRELSQTVPELMVGAIVRMGCRTPLDDATVAAYDAPFPDESYKAGARAFPALVPASPDDPASEPNRRAWKVLSSYNRPFLTAFGDKDPITRGGDRALQGAIAGAAGQAHTTLAGAGHFLQEDQGGELGAVVTRLIAATPRR